MKPDYLISTPENVDLHLELAGLGNRIFAAFIDHLLTVALLIMLFVIFGIAAVAIESLALPRDTKNTIFFYLIGFGLLLWFMIQFGYFIYFEGVWHGQTPGKRLAGIRVIEASGQPATWGAVWIRNLLRILDEGLVIIGVLAMLVDRNERRFGDLAAGTLVIKERMQTLSDKDLRISTSAPADTFVDAGQISPDEYQMLVTFLKRRELLADGERPRLATNLADYFKKKLHVVQEGDPAEVFLEKLYLAYAARAQIAAE